MTTSTTVLTSGTTAAAGPVVTASISPAAGSMLYAVMGVAGFGPPGNFSTASGAFTFTETPAGGIAPASGGRKLSIFRSSVGSSPGSSTVTLSNDANDAAGWGYQIVQISGLDTGGTNGGNSVVQTQVSTVSGTSPNSFTNVLTGYATGNPVFAGFLCDNPGTFSAISPYVEVLQTSSYAGGSGSMESYYKDPGTSSQPITHSVDFADIAIIALELKVASATIPSTGAYQQEQNTTDRYQLEDGSGVYLIEPWGQTTTFFPPRWWGDLDGIGKSFPRDRLG